MFARIVATVAKVPASAADPYRRTTHPAWAMYGPGQRLTIAAHGAQLVVAPFT